MKLNVDTESGPLLPRPQPQALIRISFVIFFTAIAVQGSLCFGYVTGPHCHRTYENGTFISNGRLEVLHVGHDRPIA